MPKKNRRPPPPGYSLLEPVLEALENELRDRVKESNDGKRNSESLWPVHQINWQRSRYVYDMYYTYDRISRRLYEYCLKAKIGDAALIAKWKKPGYERLCSTYVINPANYKFGTTSICRVPMRDRGEGQKTAQDPTTGCLGCASGRTGGGARNIFGNKYGQNLAAVQVARAVRAEAMEKGRKEREDEERRRREEEEAGRREREGEEGDGESETDEESSDEEDYGPAPAAGVWAGSRKLEKESEVMAEGVDGDDDGDASGGDGIDSRPTKKVKVTE